jgi:predicted DNA-binding transcriptional regulator AlpA
MNSNGGTCTSNNLHFLLVLFWSFIVADSLIDINDLAGILKIPTKTIRNKLSDGTWPLTPIRIGKALRWLSSDVEAFLGKLSNQREPHDL